MLAGYCRVSNREQAEDSNALEQQRLRLLARGVEPQLLFIDVQSGRSDKRSEYLKLKSLIAQGTVKQVVVTRLDRLTRSVQETAKVIDFFLSHGANLIALDDSIDLYSASGKFQVHILGALSQMESDRLSERIKHGKAHERALGYYSGKVPLGYKLQDRKLAINNDLYPSGAGKTYAEVARECVQAYLDDRSLCKAIQSINNRYGLVFSRATSFRNWLLNPVLIGTWTNLQGLPISCHEPLIDVSVRESVIAIMSRNKKVRGYGTKKDYALSSLVVCATCKLKMTRQKRRYKQSEYIYYHCQKYNENTCPNARCILAQSIEDAIIQALVSKKESLAEQVAANNISSENANKILELKNQVSQLKLIGNNSAILDAITKLEAEIESLTLGENRYNLMFDRRKEKITQVTEDPSFWNGLSEREKGDLFRAFVSRVVVDGRKIVSVDLLF